MHLNPAVCDFWAFRRRGGGAEFLLLHTSREKAERHFNGGRFWQIPSGVFASGESVTAAVDRELAAYGLRADAIWAAEHTYTIYLILSPVLVGGGKRFFPDGARLKLELLGERRFGSGVVVLRYAAVG